MLINDLLSKIKTVSANSIDGHTAYLVCCLYLFFLPAFYTIAVAAETQKMLDGEPVSQSDLMMLPPVCKFAFDTTNGGYSDIGQAKTQGLFDQPQYRIAKDNPHFHHYCWALIHKQRFFRAHSKIHRDRYFNLFMDNVSYVLVNTEKTFKAWPYFHVLLIEQAEMMKIRSNYPYSLLKIDEALRFKSDYDKAYALKSDVYLDMGDKKKAIDTAQMGLEKDPRSRLLRRRLEQLGVKVPPLLEPGADHNKGNASNSISTGASLQEDVKPLDPPPAPGNDTRADTPPSMESNIPKEIAPVSEYPKEKSYCRFCP